MKTLKKLFFLLLSFITVFLILKLFVNTDLLLEQVDQNDSDVVQMVDEPSNELQAVVP